MSAKTGFLKRKDSRRQKMLRCRVSAAVVLTLVFPLVCYGPNFAVSLAHAQGTDEKTVPQGQDPPGDDTEEQITPPTQNDGVITPPPIGDEDIHTDVPNPNAGHDEEVIPPPDEGKAR
jgi:hypothetical protein